MGLFDFLRGPDINQGVQQFRDTPGAMLLDVRETDEYAQGHIPGSKNLPLSQLGKVSQEVPDKTTPLFVHCLSGARSGQAVAALTQMGYTTVTNIGGISSYKGKVE